MKTLINISFLFLAIGFMVSCGTSEPGVKKERDYSSFNNLADILRTVGGCEVHGSGSNARVVVRGISTFKLNTEPLYIVDGLRIGNSYQMANNSVQPSQIASVRVISSKSELTIYGEQGSNGVIMIKTKQANRK